MSVRVAVFASGGGTNLQALLDHFEGADRGVAVALVVSDRPAAGALERARRAGIPTRVIAAASHGGAEAAEETTEALDAAGADVIALAGYVRLIPEAVVRRYAGRMVNVHPALLPAFGGKGMYGARVHRAVLSAGCRVSGATVHLVTERYDEGRILAQWPVPVLPGDSPETLAARVLRAEHALYPPTVEWLAGVVAGAGKDAESAAVRALSDRAVGEPAFQRVEDGGIEAEGVRRMLGLD